MIDLAKENYTLYQTAHIHGVKKNKRGSCVNKDIVDEIKVFEIFFGTAALGNIPDTYGYEVDPSIAEETILAILNGPSNFIGTSRNYVMG